MGNRKMLGRAGLLCVLLAAAASWGQAGASMAPAVHTGASARQGRWSGVGIWGADCGGRMSLRGGWSQIGEVAKCADCGLPEEYCEYSDKCQRPNKIPHARGASPNKRVQDVELGKEQEASGVGVDISQDDEELHTQAEHEMDVKQKHREHRADLARDKKEKHVVKMVTIKVDKRRAKKFVTNITGLHHYMKFPQTIKDAAKALAGMLAAGASVVKGEHGLPDHIAVQGDRAEEVSDWCSGKLEIPTRFIKISY